jgi:AraC family transcriptional regulator
MNEGEGPRLGKFAGFEQPQTLILRTLQRSELSATRLRGSFVSGTPVRLDCNDGYLVCLQRLSLQAPSYWVDGRSVALNPLEGGQFLLLDLNQEHTSVSYGDVDCISTYISREALQRFHEEHDLASIGSLRSANGVAFDDHVIRCLSESLLPALERPEAANRLFVDHVVLAFISHLISTYGEHAINPRPARGGLAPWQEWRAKELMLTNIDGNIGLEKLATECQLSRSHFARAFKITTGSSPFQWLLARRIERAKNLLLNTNLHLDQIAEQCGFVDQSHFNRTFFKYVNSTPGRWRRIRRY